MFTNTKTLYCQNIFADWLPFRDTHVHELTRHEGWADLSKRCIQCLQADAAYKCDDCFGPTVHCRGCVVSVHARLPFHRIKVSWFVSYSASQKSDFKYHSIGMAPSGKQFGSLTLDYAYSLDITAGLVRLHLRSKHHSRFTILTVHIQSTSRTANVMNQLAVISSLTSSFGRHGFLQVLLVQGPLSRSQFSNTSIISLCKARQRLMTFTTLWCMKRTILVSNRPL